MRLLWLAALAPLPLLAQGNVSTYGFGYPLGQLSARSEGAAGAFGEFDAQSPINPAALASDRSVQIHFQYDPEFRTVEVGNIKESSTTSRFPLAMVSGPLFSGGAISLSWSTLLDRTFQVSQTSTIPGYQTYDTRDTITSTIQSSGGINDLRLGLAWAFGSWLAIGGGVDAFTGENRLLQQVTVQDTIANQYAISQFKNSLSYDGIGASGGITLRPVRWLGLAGSFRYGGGISIREGDSARVAHGLIPGRVGGGLLLNPLPGLLISGRVDWEQWSRLSELGTNLEARNGTGWSVGADIEGPKIGAQRYITLRLGGGERPLPYVIAGTQIRETDLSGGLGIPLLKGLSNLDVSLTHADRTMVFGVDEKAFMLSVGLTIRP